jgi:hypothetical protein
MNLDFVSNVWDGIKPYIAATDIDEVADLVVNLCIDNDFDVSEIKEAFRGDKEIIKALKAFTDQSEEYDDYEDYEDEDYEDWD